MMRNLSADTLRKHTLMRNWIMELGSSSNNNNKYRNRLNAAPDLRIQISNMKSKIKIISEGKKKHSSRLKHKYVSH
jgi:hypothetical protein